MADAHTGDGIVVDAASVEAYVREAKVTVAAGATYVVVIGVYAALRVFADVPYLRAALGLYVVAAVVQVLLKRRVHGVRLPWLVGSAAAGLAVNAVVLVALVDHNRGTIFAEATALLLAITTTHVIDRTVARHA